MEFWKNNNKDDDCYGAKKYVEWVKKTSFEPTPNVSKLRIFDGKRRSAAFHPRLEQNKCTR
jgi:hypothetical protein